jgi:hypothetical protein
MVDDQRIDNRKCMKFVVHIWRIFKKQTLSPLFVSRLSYKSTQILCINAYWFSVTEISVVSR